VARRGAPRTNLPVERGAFVGRERALASIARGLADENARVVVLVGAAGIGKTRLALRAAARELPRFGHDGGVWLIEATGVDDGAGVVRLIGLTLGLLPDATASVDDERARVAQALGEHGPSLLLVDAIDGIDDALEALLALARACSTVRLIVTRRATCAPTNELSVLTVQALATSRRPAGDGVEAQSEAATLFVERVCEARGVQARPLGAADVDAVARIARHLDGVPQAIELAAARCRVLSPAELLERLPRNLAALAPPRHKSALGGVVAWSLDLLSVCERATLAQAVIFHGGFTLEAARAVIDLSDIPDATPVDDSVASLVDKALLKVHRRSDDDVLRYDHPAAVRDLIVLVRPQARRAPLKQASTLELLPGSFAGRDGDDVETPRIELFLPREVLVRRHASWTLSRCGALKEGVDSHGGLVARRELDAEVDNLLAVVRRSLSDDAPGLVPVTQALLALAALEPILATRGPHALFSKLLDRAVDRAVDHGGDVGVAPALVSQSLELRARLRRAMGRLADARQDLEHALALARAAGERVQEARALANLGTLAVDIGELDDARQRYDEAITIVRAHGDRRLEGRCIGYFGLLHEEAHELADAAREYEAAIAIHAACGDRRYEAIHQMQLARTRLAQGNVDTARTLLRRAQSMHRELQNRRQEVVGLTLLGDIGVAAGFFDDGAASWERAVLLARSCGDAALGALAHARLARLAQHRGQSAQSHDEHVDSALRRTDDPQIMGAVAVLRGTAAPTRGIQVRGAERIARLLPAT
jgi:predicted ATPase/tetratricopeptide (TPR) repeat protein